MLPKLPRHALNIPHRQQNRRPRPFIRSLHPPSPRHIRVHKSGTTRIHQYLSPLLPMLMCNRFRESYDARFADRIRGTRPSLFFLCTFFDGCCERLHKVCDVLDSFGGGEGGAQRGGVFAVEVAGHARDVDEAATGADEWEEGLVCC